MTEIIAQKSEKMSESDGGRNVGVKKKRPFIRNFFKKKPKEKSSTDLLSSKNGGSKHSDGTQVSTLKTTNSTPNLSFSKNYRAPLPPLSSQISEQGNRRGSHSSNSEMSPQSSTEDSSNRRKHSSTTNIASSITLSSSNSETGVDVEVNSLMRAESRRDTIYRYNQNVKTATSGEPDRRVSEATLELSPELSESEQAPDDEDAFSKFDYQKTASDFGTMSENYESNGLQKGTDRQYSSPHVRVERLSNFNLRPSSRVPPIPVMSFPSSNSPTSSSSQSIYAAGPAATPDLGNSNEYSLPVLDPSMVHDTEFHYRQISAHSKAGSLNDEYLKLMKMFNQWEALTLDPNNFNRPECALFQKQLINQHKVVYDLWEKEWEVRSKNALCSTTKPDASSIRSTSSGAHTKRISIVTRSSFVSPSAELSTPNLNGHTLAKPNQPTSPAQSVVNNGRMAQKETLKVTSPVKQTRTHSSIDLPSNTENGCKRRLSDVKKDAQNRNNISSTKNSPKLSPSMWSNNSTVLNLPISSPQQELQSSNLVKGLAPQEATSPKQSSLSPVNTRQSAQSARSSVEVKGGAGVNATIQLFQQRFNGDNSAKLSPSNSFKSRISADDTKNSTILLKKETSICASKLLESTNPQVNVSTNTQFSNRKAEKLVEQGNQKDEDLNKTYLLKKVDKCGAITGKMSEKHSTVPNEIIVADTKASSNVSCPKSPPPPPPQLLANKNMAKLDPDQLRKELQSVSLKKVSKEDESGKTPLFSNPRDQLMEAIRLARGGKTLKKVKRCTEVA